MTIASKDMCDRCKKTDGGIGWWAAAYRKREMRVGRADPGNLCGACSGSDTGKRIASDPLE